MKINLLIEPPQYSQNTEFYSLYWYMVKGKPLQTEYLDKRHYYIHEGITELWKSGGWYVGCRQLIEYLKEIKQLDEFCGGVNYLKRIFNDFDLCRDTDFKGGIS